MANFDSLATNYAKSKASDYEKKLTQMLLSPLAGQKQSAQETLKTNYDKLMGALDYSGEKLQKQYNTSAREAYVNKILSTNNLKYKLNELGLATSGAGIDQYYDLENSYGKNLAILGSTLGEGLADIEQQRKEGLSDYNAGLSDLDLKYSQLEQAAKSDIFDRLEAYKKNEYNNYYNELVRRYEAAQNSPVYKKYDDITGGGDGKVTDNNVSKITTDTIINTQYWNNKKAPQTLVNALNKYGPLGTQDWNGLRYQPAGVIYNGKDYGGIKSTGVKMPKGVKNSSGVDVGGQTVWQTSDGTMWIWNGSKMTYEPYSKMYVKRYPNSTSTRKTSTSNKLGAVGNLLKSYNKTTGTQRDARFLRSK